MKNVYLLLLTALLLSACGSNVTPTPIPTLALDGNDPGTAPVQNVFQVSGGSVVASGIVVPAQQAQLAFALAGTVTTVNVAAGDTVSAGDVLIELDGSATELEVAQAERALREMTSPAAIAAAEQAIANAQIAYDEAQKKVASYQNRNATQATLDYLEAQLVLAQKMLDQAQEAYDRTNRLSSADPLRASATTNLYNAQQAYNRAQGNLNWYTNPPSETDLALANAELDAASAALQEAQWYASELQGEAIPADATGAQLARLQQARDTLQAAQNKLALMQIRAPFAGVVTAVEVVTGEYVLPGQLLVALSDVTNLQVITTDLSERDVPNVSVGQNVSVLVEALNEQINGQVLTISSVADTLGGDVIYKTTIALDTLPAGIRAGMTVTVQYEQP